MKVIIIDDFSYAIRGMMMVAKQAGHEVLGVCLIEPNAPDRVVRDLEYPGQLLTADLDEAVRMVRSFEPDVIFMDHEFKDVSDITGKKFAAMLGYPPEKFVGTGSAMQEYCGRKMKGNKSSIGERATEGNEFRKLILETKKEDKR